ncbi:MAG: tetratricopeptide repeat protein [Candidatus Gracilibacteria bacterium]|nr:tetratricopeptide repeat protein [Candidatus Gracilibacteria bacterium]
MKKIILLIILIIFSITGLGYYLYHIEKENNIEEIEKEILGEELYNEEKKEEQGFELLKKEYASRGLTLNGDIHLENDEYILALRNYIEASKNDKNDQNIIKKIADIYFTLKNWEQAYKYYSKITNEELIDNKKLFFSLLYSTNLEDTQTFSGIIDSINLFSKTPEEKFYYTNSLECLKDFSLCKNNFQDYLEQPGFNPDSDELKNIKIVLENYYSLQLDELYYKNSLIVGVFLQNELYPIAIILGKGILEEKPNYKPILKIIAQSYFELGDYEQAKKYLNSYYNLEQDDMGASYMLGIIYQKLHDYLLSSIHFSKALKLGFPDKESIYRLQIYNAYILNDTNKIIAYFDELIKSQEKPKYKDLVLATYYNLINGNTTRGIKLTEIGLKLYPDKEDFFGFTGWVFLENGKLNEAEVALKKGFKINPENTIINYNLGKLEKTKGEYIKAMVYFKRSQKLDNGGEISKMSEIELQKLEELINSGTTN